MSLARCKYKKRHVSVTQSMHAATARAHWWRWCRHRLRLQLPLPLSLIPVCSSHSQWICNDRTGFWIRDGGRQVFKTAERGGSACSARCLAGFNVTHWVWLWGSSGCWCTTTACTWRSGGGMYWMSLWSGWGGSHALSDNCHARIFQQRWGSGVLTMDCRGYWIPYWRGIPLASWCGKGVS